MSVFPALRRKQPRSGKGRKWTGNQIENASRAMKLRDQSKGLEAPPPVPQVSEQLNYVAHSSIISVNVVLFRIGARKWIL